MKAHNPGAQFPAKGDWKEVEPMEADAAINSGSPFVIEGILEADENYPAETAWVFKEVGTTIVYIESESIVMEELLSAPFEAITPLILSDTTLYLGQGGPAYRFFLPE